MVNRHPTGTYMGIQWEVQVPPELLDGAAAPVFKHMQVGMAPELCRAETVSEPEQPVLRPAMEFQGRASFQGTVLLA